MAQNLSSIFTIKRRQVGAKRRMCAVCPEPSTMIVSVQARKLRDETRQPSDSISRQTSFCQPHGEALFRDLLERAGLKL